MRIAGDRPASVPAMRATAIGVAIVCLLIAGCWGGDDDPSEKPRAQLWFTAGEQFHPVERDLPAGERRG